MKHLLISVFFYRWGIRLRRPDVWPGGSSNLRLSGRYDTSSNLRIFTFTHFISTLARTNPMVSFPTEADDEISFNPDDVITNIEMIDEGWWKGQCHGRIGLFPAAYVQLMQWATSSRSCFKLHLNNPRFLRLFNRGNLALYRDNKSQQTCAKKVSNQLISILTVNLA